MVFINEWLPNPAGPDAAGEFIELYNDSATALPLDGWAITTEKGKTVALAGRAIPPNGYLVLKKDVTKFTLRNTDGALALYSPGGELADSAEFAGDAPEGKSFSRVSYAPGPASHFAWAGPTPGTGNKSVTITIVGDDLPYGVPLGARFTFGDFFAIMMGTAALVAAAIYYIVKHHEHLSKLFSQRNESIWTEDS